MKTKHLLTALSAVVLALGIALAGIWYNAQLPPLEPGTAASGQDSEVLFQEWAGAFPDEGSDARIIRTTLQWMAITVFCTLAATVLALHHYKPQRELGYFLLYLVILIAWAATVIRLPERGSGMVLFLRRGYFSLTVLAPIWLSAALTGMAPRTRQQKSLSLALTAGYVLLSLSTCPPVRAIGLLSGMAYCIGLLIAAYWRGDRAVLLLLFPCAATVGLRVLVILPGLELPFFSESIRFYVMRCARIYDIPFTLGCMTFVCRRFALQFDRTEQLARELDQRVADRTRALTEETEARKSMMLNIFHDLRSPLFAVSNGLDTLAEAPNALPALLPALQQRVAFVRSLTEDLFLAAKLEQKQVLLNEDRVALNEATAAVCAACQSEAAQKGVTLRAETDCFLPVWGDNVRLQQVVQNLVTNAIHYTPAGGVVTVTCAREGGTARVTVQDTGCGIAPEDQTAVFDRYFHTTANTKHDSTGLGLTIAQELAHLHHGEITLQSEVGKGSRFTLRLPILE